MSVVGGFSASTQVQCRGEGGVGQQSPDFIAGREARDPGEGTVLLF